VSRLAAELEPTVPAAKGPVWPCRAGAAVARAGSPGTCGEGEAVSLVLCRAEAHLRKSPDGSVVCPCF